MCIRDRVGPVRSLKRSESPLLHEIIRKQAAKKENVIIFFMGFCIFLLNLQQFNKRICSKLQNISGRYCAADYQPGFRGNGN
jgi:hypothetical protein